MFRNFLQRLFPSSTPALPASVAKERLQVILATQRGRSFEDSERYRNMQNDLMAVIERYVNVDSSDISITVKKDGAYNIFEMQVQLPDMSVSSGAVKDAQASRLLSMPSASKEKSSGGSGQGNDPCFSVAPLSGAQLKQSMQ